MSHPSDNDPPLSPEHPDDRPPPTKPTDAGTSPQKAGQGNGSTPEGNKEGQPSGNRTRRRGLRGRSPGNYNPPASNVPERTDTSVPRSPRPPRPESADSGADKASPSARRHEDRGGKSRGPSDSRSPSVRKVGDKGGPRGRDSSPRKSHSRPAPAAVTLDNAIEANEPKGIIGTWVEMVREALDSLARRLRRKKPPAAVRSHSSERQGGGKPNYPRKGKGRPPASGSQPRTQQAQTSADKSRYNEGGRKPRRRRRQPQKGGDAPRPNRDGGKPTPD